MLLGNAVSMPLPLEEATKATHAVSSFTLCQALRAAMLCFALGSRQEKLVANTTAGLAVVAAGHLNT